MLAKSTHLHVTPQQSTQNTAKLVLQTSEKKQCFFSHHQPGRYVSARKKKLNHSSSFVKVSVFVQSLIPYMKQQSQQHSY